MKEIDYPYVSGVGGVDLNTLITPRSTRGIITGQSGRLLSYCFEPLRLFLVDKMDEQYGLEARVVNGVATFYCFTKEIPGRYKMPLVNGRHPDLFAGKFIDLALNYFGDRGVAVDMCLGDWQMGADDFYRFKENLQQGLSRSEAAKATWSGQRFTMNGFGIIADEEVFEGYMSTAVVPIEVIDAYFHRG